MEPLHCLTPEELLALSVAISTSLYRRTDPQDLNALANLVVLVGDALILMSANTPTGGTSSGAAGPSSSVTGSSTGTGGGA